MTEEHLPPSQLGTKQYWDQAYTLESQNFNEDPTNEGQVWFSESNAESRILSFLRRVVPEARSFLDIGTGNGHLLFEMVEEGSWEGGWFVGVDYSCEAVALARSIAKGRGVMGEEEEEERKGKVGFWVADVMALGDGEEEEWVPEGGFDVCLDKGTFDAISLSDERLPDGRRAYEGYAERVVQVMKRGSGLLVVTSCNWTEEELKRKILASEVIANEVIELEYHGRIEYPSFSFGGHKGQAISSVCFRRK
ncbi:S-adenosyl-L-methionine-dependent methyltransferase [Tuber borchii]|uniref:Protein-lysine N-methyltransferase EFM4 n=1 Tax=Tuber borchii TaxID=42251 RepID=A0A2T6ZIY1_TUBBO|nr:S-adenosyl-L-methionine-dependent methyltransferase [Tuber borchii]